MHVLAADLDARPMTHGLSERVRLLQRHHLIHHGRDLSVDDALAELDRIDNAKPVAREIRPLPPEPVVEPFPYRRDIALAESKLIDLGYDDDVIALIIADIRRYGTAWSSFHFADAAVVEHTEAVEALLDSHPDWNRGEWDTTVSLGANAEPIAAIA